MERSMRRTGLNVRSIVVGLVIINVFIFLLTQFNTFPVPERLLNGFLQKGKPDLAYAARRYGFFISLFSLFPVMIRDQGWFWQFLTYMFLHGSIFHLFFNMYALFLFGRPLEQRWCWKEFLFFYLTTGIGAGIVTFFWNLMRNPFIPTIGASGAIFGIVLAFGLEFPETVLLLFFIIPVRAKYAAFIFGGIELVMILTGSLQGIGHLTHLAGLLFGYLYYLFRIRGVWIQTHRISRKSTKPGLLLVNRDALIQKALKVREKLARGQSLNRSEHSFLNKLRESYRNSRNGICGEEEFDVNVEFCKKCDDFRACLYRYIIEQL